MGDRARARFGYEPVGAEHGVTGVRITHIGPTTLIQAEGWSLLTDPTSEPESEAV